MRAGGDVLYGTASVRCVEVRSYRTIDTGQLGRVVDTTRCGFSAPGGKIPQAQPSSELNLRKGRLF